MTANEFRSLALTLPGAVESAHMGHPDFRIDGRIFATLGAPDKDWGMVKLVPEDQRSFVDNEPEVFKPCNGVWGRQGCTYVHLATTAPALGRRALEAAFKNVAAKSANRKRKTMS